MSQEKTEKATPKRRKKARDEGQVAKSNDLNSALTLFSAMLIFNAMMGTIFQKLQLMLRSTLSLEQGVYLSDSNLVSLIAHYLLQTFYMIIPFLGGVAVVGAFASFLQVGAYFNLKLLQPKFNKINPLKGFKNLFSMRSFVEMIKALFKIIVISFISYLMIKGEIDIFYTFPYVSVGEATIIVGKLIFKLGLTISLILLALGLADYLYQKYEFEKGIKMSKHEIKQEYKEVEGDPQIVGKRRERMRQLAMNRMMQAVPQADVIITNPTHIAVAIKYNIETMDAPIVLAMGEDRIAEKIKEVGKEHKIEIVENKPLARALYETAEIGQSIPVDLYQAVAEVLAFVYRLQNRKF